MKRSGMVSIAVYQGPDQFGPAYKTMLENDTHAPGSIDRVLMEKMIRLCSETADYLYNEYTPTRSCYQQDVRPELERYVETVLDCHSNEERIEAITRFTSGLGEKAEADLALMRVGGTEEEIIARGSDWCTDVARVGCALCQVVGFPARMVYLVDTAKAYSGHVIIEVYRAEVWGAVDPLTDVIYCHTGGKPASTWDLMRLPRLIERHSRDKPSPYVTVGQFRRAAISNYFVWRWGQYNYAVSEVNDYYRSILEMSAQGWPGGLRWLYGEDVLAGSEFG